MNGSRLRSALSFFANFRFCFQSWNHCFIFLNITTPCMIVVLYFYIVIELELSFYMIDNYYTFNNEIFNLGLSDENITKKQLVEKIQSHISNTSVNYSDYYVDPDKRDYIVSNEKIEETGWKPIFTLDDGIKELIQSYKMIVPTQSQYRNTTPLSYKE